MRRKKLLSKALSVLLSGAMLAGVIPASAFAEEYDLPLLEAVDTAGIEGHTRDGYFCVWSEDFEYGEIPSGWGNDDNDLDGHKWEIGSDTENGNHGHCGEYCVFSESRYEGEALNPKNRLSMPSFYLESAYDWVLTFMAAGTGINCTEKFTVNVTTDEGATYTQLDSFTTTGEWQEIAVDLSDYVGNDVIVAIDHTGCTDQYALRLDCFNLWAKQVHSLEGYPFNAIFDDFEGDIRPTYYLAESGMWETLESIESHHGYKCLESLPEGKEIGVSGTNTLVMDGIRLSKDNDYALSFMVRGENAGTLQVSVVTADGKMYQLLSQTVDTNEWQEVTVDLEGFSGRTVDIHIIQRANEADSMYIDCLGLWYTFAHFYGDGRTLVWSEDFEESGLPDGWEIIEKDGDGYNWEVEYQDSDIKKHHGIGSVYSESAMCLGDEPPTNNWLLLPRRTLSGGKRYILTFEAVEQADADKNKAEKFGVFVSTDGGKNYTQLGEDYTTTSEWQEIEVNLSAYAGKTVDIAVVHHNCTDQYRLVLDCFNLWELPIGQISAIQANITEPKTGDTPAATATFTTEPAGGVAEHSIAWSKVPEADYNGKATTGWSALEEDEKFEAGYYYAMEMGVYLTPGYTMASTVSAKVNSFETYEYHESGDSFIQLAAIVPPLKNEITNISATITEPVIGATPDFSPIVTFTPEKSAYVDSNGVYWAKIAKADYTGTSDDKWFAMGATEKFEAGYIYSVEISMSTEDGYKVGDKCTGTINGKPHDDFWGPFVDDPYAPYLFMRFGEPKTAVTSISATVTPPVIGATPDFDPVVTFDPENSAYVDYVYWAKIAKADYTGNAAVDEWVAMGATEKFQAGYIYSVEISMSTEDGYKIGDDCTGTINGVPHDDYWGPFVDDPYAPYLFMRFDPEVPNPVATAGNGQVALKWNAVPNATEYVVYFGTGTNLKVYCTTTALGKTVSGLTNGTEYTFLVRAKVNGVWSKFTAANYVYATPVAPPVTKPVVKAVAGDGRVALTWDKVDGATEYVVYVGTGTSLKVYCTTTALGKTVSSLVNGTKYTFLVRANVDGVWSKFTAEDYVYATPVAPVVAKPVVKAVAGDGRVALSWDKVTGATEYVVYVGTGTSLKVYCTTTALGKTVSSLVNGTMYTFLVRAKVDGVWTKFTAEDYVYATPQAVGTAKPVVKAVAGDGKVALTWGAVTGATQYVVYVGTGSSLKVYCTTTALGKTVSSLKNGTEYTFLVRAYVDGAWTKFTAEDYVYATPKA